MSDDIYFIRVEGADRDLMEQIVETADDWEFDDNIVVIPKEVEPVDRSEVKEWLQQFADALDMELVEADDE